MNWNKIYRGNINREPSIIKLKKAMIELLKGYPAFLYYGIFESYFNGVSGSEIVSVLEADKLINVIRQEGKPPLYKLTPKGMDVAVSMINLDYSEQTRKFTIGVIALTIITIILGLNQLLFAYLQYSTMG